MVGVFGEKANASQLELKSVSLGEEGLKNLSDWSPDVLLLSLSLKDMDGFAFLTKKNSLGGELANIPVILISDAGLPTEISQALSLGVKDYVVKAQFNAEELLAKIHAQIKLFDILRHGQDISIDKSETVNRQVVWVEDDKFLSDLIAKKVSGSDEYKFIFFRTGEEALEYLDKSIPDIIVLDILLPGMDGFEILRRIKDNKNLKEVPVILFSNFGQDSDRKRGEELGAAKFLVKATMNLDEVIDAIKEIVREKNLPK